MADPGKRLLRLWNRLAPWPGGPWLFSRLLGRIAPYSGSIRPDVLVLEPGHTRVAMRDRRALRNPFASVHAVALANLGELASGLAVWTLMPPTLRGIVTGLSIRFDKKARGRLIAESHVTLPTVTEPRDHDVVTTIRDQDDEVVAEVRVTWRLDIRP